MFIQIDCGKNITAKYKQKVHTFFLQFSLDYTDDFRLILKNYMILKSLLKITTFRRFSLIYLMISGFNILKVIFKSNSVSINKKNHINIKCSLLKKMLYSVRTVLHKTVKKTYQILTNDYNPSIHQFKDYKISTFRHNKV